jgi:hypothetical protein
MCTTLLVLRPRASRELSVRLQAQLDVEMSKELLEEPHRAWVSISLLQEPRSSY